MKKLEDKISKIENVLYKKAIGYLSEEITEDYVNDENGDVKLIKRKVQKKLVPPDLASIKTWMEKYISETNDYSSLSDEEILQKYKEINKQIKKLLKEKI